MPTTVTNREVFLVDPTTTTIPNEGVAKIIEPRTQQEWDVLRYELHSFVCEGEYRRGLELILATYLSGLNKPTQPAVWVSGFYGSGKSHLVRVLEYLWRDVPFPDGATARGITNLPPDIQAQLIELSTAGKREGGLWSAAGTLGAGSGNSVRLALTGLVLRSAGLPEQYAPARLVIWLKQNDYYDSVVSKIEAQGRELGKELVNMYVSPYLANALLETVPDFASSAAAARDLIKMQYPRREDISDDELLQTIGDVLDIKGERGKRPCTVLILDELQQFIGDDNDRTRDVQEVVESCSSRFGSRLLFVATGQAAMGSTTQLQKLQGRFTVRVALSDSDVDRVVREVVLRKQPGMMTTLSTTLDNARGEIDRHLAGTHIGPQPGDEKDLVPDYPLLPVRRRFWEHVLRSVDQAGTAGQLRTQLRVVHEAIKSIASDPVGVVVPGDILYTQLKADMLQSRVLPRELATLIDQQNDSTSDGILRARLCATIFLITQLTTGVANTTSVRATVDTLADLLVSDLKGGSSQLRDRIPDLLQGMVDQGILMRLDGEYRLQTRESAEWTKDFNARFRRIADDEARVGEDRARYLNDAVSKVLKALTLTQGQSKTGRKLQVYFSDTRPPTDSAEVPVWVRDGWGVSESSFREEARAAGPESPIVFVFVPREDATGLRDTIARVASAEETINSRPTPTTEEGREALSAMKSRQAGESAQLQNRIENLLKNARVWQGGGNDIAEGTLRESVRVAADNALVRLFPRFGEADKPQWDKVVDRARQGAADALSTIGYDGDVDKHPVCAVVLAYVGGAGKKGSQVRKQFGAPPYGWPQDAIDGALMALLAVGAVRAIQNGQPAVLKSIAQSQIPAIDFYTEGAVVTTQQRIALRSIFSDLGLPVNPGEETSAAPRVLNRLLDSASAAGGDAPQPARPDIEYIQDLRGLSGNQQLLAIYEARERLRADYAAWNTAKGRIAERLARWQLLQRLLRQAVDLPIAAEVRPQVEAIEQNRALLNDPDPVQPLLDRLAGSLRAELVAARQRLQETRNRELDRLGQSQDWGQLSETQRTQLLTSNRLGDEAAPDVSTAEALATALDARSLSYWGDRVRNFSAGVSAAIAQAAKMLEPEVVQVRPPASGTLRNAADVDSYLAVLRDKIMEQVEAGKPVIVS